jgi:hypothetical protein
VAGWVGEDDGQRGGWAVWPSGVVVAGRGRRRLVGRSGGLGGSGSRSVAVVIGESVPELGDAAAEGAAGVGQALGSQDQQGDDDDDDQLNGPMLGNAFLAWEGRTAAALRLGVASVEVMA